MSKPVKCPACSCEVPRIDIRPGGFTCPNCHQMLRIDTRRTHPLALASLMLGGHLSYLLGYSDIMFILYMLLVGAAMFLVAALINRWFFLKLARDDSAIEFRITGPRDSE